MNDNPDSLPWLAPVLVVAGVATAAVLAFGVPARLRNAAIATALATLLIAPAAWSVQTLGHATSGTFPAGGPANAGGGFGGRAAAAAGPGGGGGFGGPPRAPTAAASPRAAPPRAPTAAAPPGGGSGRRRRRPGRRLGGPGGGGAFGGNSASLTTALEYIQANGGGTLAVSSQSTAAAAIVDSDADIVGLGGFSGRESEVSVSWFADQVRAGNIRWVLADGSGGGGLRNDGRTGSTTVDGRDRRDVPDGRGRRRDALRLLRAWPTRSPPKPKGGQTPLSGIGSAPGLAQART